MENVVHDNGYLVKKVKDDRGPTISSEILPTNSEKLNLSRRQFFRRRKKILAALGPIHTCSGATKNLPKDNKPVVDGLWTTFISTASKPEITNYIRNSNICMQEIIPGIVNEKIKSYEQSKGNQVRNLRVLYEGGLISKRKYTSIRNSSDVVKETGKKKKNKKTELMKGCEVPKILPYKTLMSFVKDIEIGEVLSLEDLASKYSLESTSGVYRPLKPFLLRLSDMYLLLNAKNPCLHWFNGEKGVLHVAIGADGAPFGKDDTATGIC